MSRISAHKDRNARTGITLRVMANKRKRGMQTYTGKIRVEANLYQAFVIPEFFPEENFESSDEDCSTNSNVARLLYSPKLFDDTTSTVAAYQQIFFQSNKQQEISEASQNVITPEIPNYKPTNLTELVIINPIPDESTLYDRKARKSISARTVKAKASTIQRKLIKHSSESHLKPKVSKNSKLKQQPIKQENSSDSSNKSVSSVVSNKLTEVQSIKDEYDKVISEKCDSDLYSKFLANHSNFTYQKQQLEDPISASVFLSTLRSVFQNFETPFCSIDISNVYELLYKNVMDDIRAIIATNPSLKINDCWTMRKYIHHLIYKHVLNIFKNSPNELILASNLNNMSNTNVDLNPIDPETTLLLYVRACAKRQRIAPPLDKCTEEAISYTSSFNSPSKKQRLKAPYPSLSEKESVTTDSFFDLPLAPHASNVTSKIKILRKEPPYLHASSPFISSSSPPSSKLCSFSDLCVHYEELHSRIKSVAAWKQAVSNIYCLQNNERVPVSVAKKILEESDILVNICDLSEERNRLKCDIANCESLREEILKNCSHIFNKSSDSNAVFDINIVKPYIGNYNQLVFSIDEGEYLLDYLESVASWQQMIANAIHGKDLDQCKDLVDTYDETNFKLNISNLKNLREDVKASQWLDRIQRILDGRKIFTLNQVNEFLTPAAQTFLVRFREQNEIFEFLKYCKLAHSWLKKSVSPPYANTCTLTEYTELRTAYHMLSKGLKEFHSVVSPESAALYDTSPEESKNFNENSETEIQQPNDISIDDVSSKIQKNKLLRMTEAELNDFCNSYQSFRITIPAVHVFEDFRQRVIKWKKKFKRALSSHNSILLVDAQNLLKDGISISQHFDIDSNLQELEEVIRRHELWIIQADEFINHVRFLLGETLFARASNYFPVKICDNYDQEQVNNSDASNENQSENRDIKLSKPSYVKSNNFHEIIELLEGPPNCVKPCLDDLSRLLAQHSESFILDNERQKMLKQLQAHADRWKRRVRDCLKLRTTLSSVTDSLKCQLLLEAKYFCIDLKSEQQLAKPFYLKLWRNQVLSLQCPIQEAEFFDLVSLPDAKEFSCMFHKTKSLYSMQFTDRFEEISKDSDKCSEQLCETKMIEGTSISDSVICDKILSTKDPNTILKYIIHEIPECLVTKALSIYRSHWFEQYYRLVQQKPTKEVWNEFEQKVKQANFMQLTSIICKINEHLLEVSKCENDVLNVIQNEEGVDLLALRKISLYTNECPVQISCWIENGLPLLCALEALESKANKFLYAKMNMDTLKQAENFLNSIPKSIPNCHGYEYQIKLNEKSLFYVEALNNRIITCQNWLKQLSKYHELSSNIDEWCNFIKSGHLLNIEVPDFDRFIESVMLSEQWIRLFNLCKDLKTGKVDLCIAYMFLNCKEPILRSQELYYQEVQNEFVKLSEHIIPNNIELLKNLTKQSFDQCLTTECIFENYDSYQQLITLIRNLSNVLYELKKLKHISAAYLEKKLTYEIDKYTLMLYTVFSLNCCLPHPGCPWRSIELVNDTNLCHCNYLVPSKNIQDILKSIDENENLLDDLNKYQYKLESVQLENITKDLEFFFPSISEAKKKQLTANDAVSGLNELSISMEISPIFRKKLVQSLNSSSKWINKLDEFVNNYIVNVKDLLSVNWYFPEINSNFWDIWALTPFSDFSPWSSVKELTCPSDRLKTMWQKRWIFWINRKNNVVSHSKEFSKQKITRSNLYTKLTETSLTSELCNNSHFDIPLNQILRKPLLNNFIATFKCPWNTRCYLNLANFKRQANVKCEWIWPITSYSTKPELTEENHAEWKLIAEHYKKPDSTHLLKLNCPTLNDALDLINSINLDDGLTGLQPVYQILYESILIELLWLSNLKSIAQEPLLSLVCPLQEVESISHEITEPQLLLKKFEECELLAIQSQVKYKILSILYETIESSLQPVEMSLCLPLDVFKKYSLNIPVCLYGAKSPAIINRELHDALFKNDVFKDDLFSLKPSMDRYSCFQKIIESTQIINPKYLENFDNDESTLYRCLNGFKLLENDIYFCTICGGLELANDINFIICSDCNQKFHVSCVEPGFNVSDVEFQFACFLCLSRRSKIETSFIQKLPMYLSNLSSYAAETLRLENNFTATTSVESNGNTNLDVELINTLQKPSFSYFVSQISNDTSYGTKTHPLSNILCISMLWILDVASLIYGTQLMNSSIFEAQHYIATEANARKKQVNSNTNTSTRNNKVNNKRKQQSVSSFPVNASFSTQGNVSINPNQNQTTKFQTMSNRQSTELSNSSVKNTIFGCFKFNNLKTSKVCATVNWSDVIYILNSNKNVVYSNIVSDDTLITIAKQLRHCCTSISGKPFDSLYDATQVVQFFLPFNQSMKIPYSKMQPSSNSIFDLKHLILRSAFLRLQDMPFFNYLITLYRKMLNWDTFLQYIIDIYFSSQNHKSEARSNYSELRIILCEVCDYPDCQAISDESLKPDIVKLFHPYRSVLDALLHSSCVQALEKVSEKYYKSKLFRSPKQLIVYDRIYYFENAVQLWLYNIYHSSTTFTFNQFMTLFELIRPCIDVDSVLKTCKSFIMLKWLEFSFNEGLTKFSKSFSNLYNLLCNSIFLHQQHNYLRDISKSDFDYMYIKEIKPQVIITDLIQTLSKYSSSNQNQLKESICDFLPQNSDILCLDVVSNINQASFNLATIEQSNCDNCISDLLKPIHCTNLFHNKLAGNDKEMIAFAKNTIIHEKYLKNSTSQEQLEHSSYHNFTPEQLESICLIKTTFLKGIYLQQCIWGVIQFMKDTSFDNLSDPLMNAVKILVKNKTSSNQINYSVINELYNTIQASEFTELKNTEEFSLIYRETQLINQTLESYIDKKTPITSEVYTHISTILQQHNHIWFDHVSEWFQSTTHMVTRWFDDARNIFQQTLKNPSEALSKSLILKRLCKNIPVDLSKTRVFIKLKNYIRDLRRQDYFNKTNNKSNNTGNNQSNNKLYNSWNPESSNAPIFTPSTRKTSSTTFPISPYPYAAAPQEIICGAPTSSGDVPLHPGYHPFPIFALQNPFTQASSQIYPSGEPIYSKSTASPTK